MACIRLSALLSIFFILFSALALVSAHPNPQLDPSSLTGGLPSGGTGGTGNGLPTNSLPLKSLPLDKLSAVTGTAGGAMGGLGGGPAGKLPLSMPKMPAGTEMLGGLTKTFTNEGSLVRLARRRRSMTGASGMQRIPRRVRKVSSSVLKH